MSIPKQNTGTGRESKTPKGLSPYKLSEAARTQSRGGKGKVPVPPKCASIQSEPVLFFDNKPSGSHQTFELLTIPETAEFLKISETGVRRLQQGRAIPFIKVGGSVRFAKSDIMSYLEKRRVESIG